MMIFDINFADTPISTHGCEYLYGIYEEAPGQCSTYYIKCADGVPHQEGCDAGLAYDARIHGCNWPDLLEQCEPEAVVGFKCPSHIDPHSPAARFLPFPRFPVQDDPHRFILCVENKPRLISCGDESLFNPQTLACEEI